MAYSADTTTFVCLFHHEAQAQGAVRDLVNDGVPENVIYTLDRSGEAAGTTDGYRSTLEELHVPERDVNHLLDEIGKGGILIAVAFATDFTDRIEGIFQRHAANKIDEVLLDGGTELNAAGDALLESDGTVGSFGSRKYRPIVEGTGRDDDRS